MSVGERAARLLKYLLPVLILALLSPLPDSEAVRTALRAAQRAQARGDFATAAVQLREAVEREPWRVQLWEQIGLAELSDGALEPARQALAQAERAGALSEAGQLTLGQILSRLDRPAEAQDTWQRLLARAATADLREQTYTSLTVLLREQGQYGRAIEVLRAWRAERPDSAFAAYQLGLALAVDQPDQALAPLLESAQLDPRYTARVQTLRRGWNLASGSDDPAYRALQRGRALAAAGEWNLAAALFQQAVEANAQYAEAWAFLSEALFHIQQDGAQEMQQALSLEPDSVVVRALAAVQARRQGDPARALEYLDDLVRDAPEEPIWQVEMGAALAQAGDLSGAYQAYSQAAAMAPQTPLYWQYLAGFSIQYNYDLTGVGLAAARRAVILAPEDPASQDVMGMVLLSVGDWASAERYLQHALAGDATYAPAALHLGMLYLRQEMYDQAHPYLQRALSLDSDGATGQVARRLLRQNYGEQ